MESTLNKPLVGNLVYSLLGKRGNSDWHNKPADWSDIRKDCPESSIALYVAHSTDYSSYDNFGFKVTCTDGYNVFIDGTQYGTTYASGSQCNITWSSLALTTGDDITTPSALKAHKIWIEPATSGNNITAFKCARVAASGNEQQGVLWAHFNLTNEISLASGFGTANNYQEAIMRACTAKGNTIKIKDIQNLFINTSSLEYSAVLDNNNNSVTWYSVIRNSGIPEITIKNGKPTSLQYFAVDSSIENLNFENCDFSSVTNISGAFGNTTKIKKFPEFNFSSACLGGTEAFLSNCSSLTEDYVLDLSNCTALNKIVIKQTARFKGLRVSSSAPFDGAAPQINVSYTGMDRNAIVQLFNDLPANVGYIAVGSPTITSGIMSNISTSNYAKTGASFTMTDEDSWVLEVPIITGNDIDSGQNVISEDTHFSIGIGEVNKHFNYYLSNNGTYWTTTDGAGSHTLSANTNYTWKGEYNGQTKTFNAYVKTGNGDYELDYTNTNGIKFFTKFLKFGVSRTTIAPWKGSIDIANSKFYINGNSCYSGKVSSAKTITVVNAYGDSVILSNVGAPTIIDGVITKMDASNFVKTGSFAIGNSANWSAEIPLITGNDISSPQNFFSEKDHYSFSFGVNGGKFAYSLSKNGVSWAVSDFGTHTLQPNTLYYWKVEYNATSKVFNGYIKEEGGTYELDFTYTEGIQNPTQYLQFGVSRSSSLPWLGSIVLKDVVITVNDTVWLTDGNFLYPADKVIATNKGWTLLV